MKYAHGLIPGPWWNPHVADYAGIDLGNLQLFYVLYFIMTGMHALHMVIGLGIGIWLIVMSVRRTYGKHRYLPIEFFGFYWHFVDVVWVFLFPLFYLVSPAL